jgi:isoleucyl-tRNA synthetase
VSISEKILTQTAEIYRRIRNSLFKFCLANIADFNYLKNKNTEYREVDQFILQQLANNVKKINEAYKSYNFSQVVQIINNHVIELSSWYFDIIKDALYCETPDEPVRRVIQTVLHKILHTYLVLLTPIVPHTCEEAYEVLKISEKSVMFEQWINKLSIKVNHSIVDKINYFLSLRQRIYNELERLRNNKVISKNNQAVVTIHFENIQEFDPITLAQYLNVAKVNIVVVKGDIIIECDNAHLVKCERC